MDALEHAMRDFSAGNVAQPVRQFVQVPGVNARAKARLCGLGLGCRPAECCTPGLYEPKGYPFSGRGHARAVRDFAIERLRVALTDTSTRQFI